MMSNALYFGGSAGPCGGPIGTCITVATQPAGPTSAPAEGGQLSGVMLILLGVGSAVLIAWLIRVLSRPGRLRLGLAQSPDRANRLSLLHAALAWIFWQFAMGGAAAVFAGLLAPAPVAPPATQPAITQPVTQPTTRAESQAATRAATQPATRAATRAATRPTTQAASESAEAMKDPRVMFASMAAGSVIFLAMCLLIAVKTFDRGLADGLGLSLKHPLGDLGRAVGGYLAIYPLCLGLFVLSMLLLPPKLIRTHEVLRTVGEVSAAWKVVAAVGTVVLAPLAEEVFFRGLVQTWFRGALRSPALAIVITSAIFALVHANLEPQAIPSLFVLALALGYCYERTGRLTSAILIHAIFNGVNLAPTIL